MIFSSLSSFFNSLVDSLLINSVQVLSPQTLSPQTQGQNIDPRQMLLAQLKDIKTPQEVSWWPPAPGWWLLGALLIAASAAAIIFFIKRRQQARYRKIALEELTQISKQSDTAAQNMMQLLKRVCFSAYPQARDALAGLYGAAFLETLQALTPKLNLAPELKNQIAALLYRPDNASADREALVQSFKEFTEAWINKHPKNSPRVSAVIEHSRQNLAFDTQAKESEVAHV